MPVDKIRPFHFWAQKALPLVFDDALSYYEVLAKVVDYLNRTIAQVDENTEGYDELVREFNELQSYVDNFFTNLNVQQEISEKLDDMASDGSLNTVILPVIAEYANPSFVSSTDDMTPAGNAYVFDLNQHVYTWDSTKRTYSDTGHIYGGTVTHPYDFTDTSKYYALASDGLLYAYDYENQQWSSTGLVFAGIRDSVQDMVPFGKVYVLTSDMHVYTWDGGQYADSGVVYGSSQAAFIWRKTLTSADSAVNLTQDGWYSFEFDNMPQNLPQFIAPSDGFLLRFTDADSGISHTVLKTDNGGSWAHDGFKWLNETPSGFTTCTDCDKAPQNSYVWCPENCENAPTEEAGVLVSQFAAQNVQWFVSNDSAWFRSGVTDHYSKWKKTADDADLLSLSCTVNQILPSVYGSFSSVSSELELTNNRINDFFNLTADLSQFITKTENNDLITDNYGNFILSVCPVIKTDNTLTEQFMPADAKATGDAVNSLEYRLSADSSNLNAHINDLDLNVKSLHEFVASSLKYITVPFEFELLTDTGSQLQTQSNISITASLLNVNTDTSLSIPDVPADSLATGAALDDLASQFNNNVSLINNEITEITNSLASISNSFTLAHSRLETENQNSICSQSENELMGVVPVIKTDDTLTEQFIPADAKTTGQRLESIEQYYNINQLRSVYGTGISPVSLICVNIDGELPVSKTNVSVTCSISGTSYSYSGHALLKVQGSSSVSNPEKNYTLTLDNNITVGSYSNNVWNLKCNYIDPSQIRNILCARLWAQSLELTLGLSQQNLCTQNNDMLLTQNNNSLVFSVYNSPLANSPHLGCTDGVLCVVTHNGSFHGLYTIGIPKSAYMLGMDLSEKQFVLSASLNAYMNPYSDSDSFYSHYEIELNSPDMTDTVIYQKTNSFFSEINSATSSTLLDVINSRSSLNTMLTYICFSWFTNNLDGIGRNYLLFSFDGGQNISLSAWDMDCTFGNNWTPLAFNSSPMPFELLKYPAPFRKLIDYYPNLVKDTWTSLRNGPLSLANVRNIIYDLCALVNNTFYSMDFAKWNKGKTSIMSPDSILHWLLIYLPFLDDTINNLGA